MKTAFPRLVIAGAAGDSGKTLVSMGLCVGWQKMGLAPFTFKKGPDYIDAAWLALASEGSCRNLDSFFSPPATLVSSFVEHASRSVNIIEGNRGFLDGMDAAGSHSTASLARLLQAPVVLVVSATKVTRTVAALILGCRQLEPDVHLAGVVLNRISGPRHEAIVRKSVEELAGVEVVGVLPRLSQNPLPGRHLGLVPPQEHEEAQVIREAICQQVEEHVDLQRLLEIARAAPALATPPALAKSGPVVSSSNTPTVRIGVFSDSAFTFYYPENLEALEAAGAELISISGLSDTRLPQVDALYLGGGFPETHAAKLSANTVLHHEMKQAADSGLPIYAECGGLIFLSRSLTMEGRTYPMAGVLPVKLELFQKPQGHGYMEIEVEGANPFFEPGVRVRGHEFHYTRPTSGVEGVRTLFKVHRGVGCGDSRDGIIYKNVLASYMHIHALGVPDWAPALVKNAVQYRKQRSG